MEFWASAEVSQVAFESIANCADCVEPFLNKEFGRSKLAELDLKIRYVPIVMPDKMHAEYKERSRAYLKKNIYDCSPHLDFRTFTSAGFPEQLTEYLRGIRLCCPHLKRFGANLDQISDFNRITKGAVENIIRDQRPLCI